MSGASNADDIVDGLKTVVGSDIPIFLTANGGAETGKALSPGLAKRFSNVVLFKPLADDTMNLIAARMAAKELGDNLLPPEEARTVGALLMETIAADGYNPEEGARGVSRRISKILSGQMSETVEDSLAAHFPVFAGKVSQRRAGRLADTFQQGTQAPVTTLKPLRIRNAGMVTA